MKIATKPLKVVILGGDARPFSETSYDDTWEFWCLNCMYRRQPWVTRWNRVFNLHRFAHLDRDAPQYIDADIAFSRTNPKIPIYVVDSWHGWLTNQVIFPRRELEAMPRGRYHAGSFDWLVAFAIHLKAKIISLHGINLAWDSWRDEPISARACLEYWCGYAEALGCKVWTASDCDLFYQYHIVRSRTVYGYDDVVLVEKRR